MYLRRGYILINLNMHHVAANNSFIREMLTARSGDSGLSCSLAALLICGLVLKTSVSSKPGCRAPCILTTFIKLNIWDDHLCEFMGN